MLYNVIYGYIFAGFLANLTDYTLWLFNIGYEKSPS